TLAAESGAPILLHGQVDLKIRQLHRMEAWRRMLGAFRGSGLRILGWNSLGRVTLSVIGALLSGGITSAVGKIDARYRALVYAGQIRRWKPDSVRQVMKLRRSRIAPLGEEIYLEPAGQLQRGSIELGTWSATGNDPRFVLTAGALGSALLPGW